MHHHIARRRFFKQLSVGSAALTITPTLLGITATAGAAPHAVHLPGLLPVALVEDCFDTAFALPNLSNTSKIAVAGNIDLKIPGNKGRLAFPLVLRENALLAALEKIKQAPDGKKDKSHDKLSFLFGIMCNNVLQRHIQSVYQQYPEEIEEMSIYQDTHLLRTLAGAAVDKVQQADLDQLLRVLLPRTITRVHTLIPDSRNGPDWVVNMGRWREENQLLMEKYARIYTHPDEGKKKKYVTDTNVYQADDAIITLCRKTQNGERISTTALLDSIAARDQGSIYAQSLATGVHHIRTVDEFLTNTIDGPTLLARLKQ